MSYIGRPRIGFGAGDAMANPSTANNENAIHLLDTAKVELVNPPVVKGVELPKMDDASYRAWMLSLVTVADPPASLEDASRPEWEPTMPGYWNYYGDQQTTFGSAEVKSVWVGAQPVTAPGADPLLGARVVYSAKLVDLDPADTFSSQLIAGHFALVGAGKDGRQTQLLAGMPTIAHSRWLNIGRPGGAGTFQSVISNDTLTFVDEQDGPASPGLAALRAGAARGGGLVLRFCLYNLRARHEMMEMYDRFQAGEVAINPKYGNVLGTIGVWNGTDLATAPVGRVLQRPGPPYFAASAQSVAGTRARARPVKSHEDVEAVYKPGMAAFAASQETNWAEKMGPAVAVVQDGRVVLDLLTAFPEDGSAADPLAKHDFGVVELVVCRDGPDREPVVSLGAVAYDRQTYEQLGGVVELPLPAGGELPQQLAAGWLSLRDARGRELLREVETVLVETDDRNVYLDLERDGERTLATGGLELHAFHRGAPIEQPVTVGVELYQDVMHPGEVNSVKPLVVIACEMVDEQLGVARTIELPAGGRARLPLEASEPGCFKVRFLPPGMHAGAQPNFLVELFANYRALPFDDYTAVPDEQLTWSFVYEQVFNYYAVLYPVMSLIIPWGADSTPTDPERVAQFASLLRQAVDESRVGTALAMPITRELSVGKRVLVQRWCDLQLRDDGR